MDTTRLEAFSDGVFAISAFTATGDREKLKTALGRAVVKPNQLTYQHLETLGFILQPNLLEQIGDSVWQSLFLSLQNRTTILDDRYIACC
jgi:hypothetical protein